MANLESTLYFDGKSNAVEVKNAPNPAGAITVSCWVKSQTATWNQHGCLVSKRDAYIIHCNQGAKSLTFYIFSGDWRSVGWPAVAGYLDNLDITQWHHYAGTFDGSTMRFYIDGKQINEVAYQGTIDADTGPMYIGHDDGLAGRYFNGNITEVSVWNKALTEGELNAYVSSHRRLKGNEGGLIGYWPLHEGQGTISQDQSPSAHPGTILGASWVKEESPFLPDVFQIKVAANDAVLDVAGGQTDPNTIVLVYAKNGGDGQQWQITADGVIKSKLGDYALDVMEIGNPFVQLLVINPINGSATQKWEVGADGTIKNKSNGRAIAAYHDPNSGYTVGLLWPADQWEIMNL